MIALSPDPAAAKAAAARARVLLPAPGSPSGASGGSYAPPADELEPASLEGLARLAWAIGTGALAKSRGEHWTPDHEDDELVPPALSRVLAKHMPPGSAQYAPELELAGALTNYVVKALHRGESDDDQADAPFEHGGDPGELEQVA